MGEKKLKRFNDATKVPEMKNANVHGGGIQFGSETAKTLLDSMWLGIGIVLAVSLISLTVSTGNVIVAILALTCITGILCKVFVLIYLLGWKLGVTESIAVVISIGFSFDYIAHIANAYVEPAESDSKQERTKTALTELGISVLAGAVSILLSSAVLLLQLFFSLSSLLFSSSLQ